MIENYLYLRHKFQNKAIVLLCSLATLAIVLTAVGVRENRSLKFSLTLLGSIVSIVGLSANRNFLDLDELLEDSEYVAREQRLIRLQAPFTAVAESKAASKPEKSETVILEASEQWLDSIVQNSHHFRICGETGSGKSTLVDNLINCLKQNLGESVQTCLIDPKYPLSDFDIEPSYAGIDKALEGLAFLAGEVEARLGQARIDKKAGLQIRGFTPYLFIVDEIDMIASQYKKDAANLLRIGLKVGRALNVKVCYIGQSPLCSSLYLNKSDFKNSANILLGEMSLLGLNEVCYRQQKADIEAQLIARQERGDRFFAVVKAMGKAPFTALLPEAKAYSLKAETSENSKQEQILEFWAKGEKRKKVIIPAIWGKECTQGSSAYKKAVIEYSKLAERLEG